MSVIARRRASELTCRRVTGTPQEVASIVARVRQAGLAVSMTVPQRDHRGRMFVDLTFLAPPVRRPRRVLYRRLAVAAAVVAVVAGLVVGVWLLLLAVAAAAVAAFPYAAGVLVLAALLVWRGGHSGACTGLHCGGCRG